MVGKASTLIGQNETGYPACRDVTTKVVTNSLDPVSITRPTETPIRSSTVALTEEISHIHHSQHCQWATIGTPGDTRLLLDLVFLTFEFIHFSPKIQPDLSGHIQQ